MSDAVGVSRLACRVGPANGATLSLEMGSMRCEVAKAQANGLATGTEALMFLRPEELSPVGAGDQAANLGTGTVDTHVHQGTHVDVYVRFDDGRVLRARHGGFDAIERFPAGSKAGVRANLEQVFLFPES